MSWTEKVSTRIARQIKVAESPYSVGQISHGIEIVLLYLFNAMALLLSSYLLDVFFESILVAFFYILHRSFTSGVHMSSPWTCLVIGVSSVVAGSLLLKHLPDFGGYAYLLVSIIFLASFWVNYRYAPTEHTYVSTDESIKKICRIIILTLLIIGCAICNLLVYFDYTQLAFTYSFAVFLQSLFLHPVSFWMVSRFEKLAKVS